MFVENPGAIMWPLCVLFCITRQIAIEGPLGQFTSRVIDNEAICTNRNVMDVQVPQNVFYSSEIPHVYALTSTEKA